MKEKKLYKSITDKKIFGVCGGLAEYFGTDAVIIRILWIIATFFFGSGVICYLVCAFVMPSAPSESVEYEYIHKADHER